MEPNVQQTVPFLWITDMNRSLDYYVGDLGFEVRHQWAPEGEVRWAWLANGGASLMLQGAESPRIDGDRIEIYFICEDALSIYRSLRSRGVATSEPEVGNGMWEFGLSDPDGHRLHFESVTDVPEDTKLRELGSEIR